MRQALFAVILLATTAVRQTPSETGTTVGVVVERTSPTAVYGYTVTNLRGAPITTVHIGLVEGIDEPELATEPVGWTPINACPKSIAVPAGWTGCVGLQEDSSKIFLEFRALESMHELTAGRSLRVTVELQRADPTCETPVFWAVRNDARSDRGRVVSDRRYRK